MELQEQLIRKANILEHGQSDYKLSFVYGVIKYPRTGKETEGVHKFMIDTGAAISILNVEFEDFIDRNFKAISHAKIMYGGSVKRLPVYEFNIEIKGHSFHAKMAFDDTLHLPSLLGQFDFLNKFFRLNIDYSADRNYTKLIWK